MNNDMNEERKLHLVGVGVTHSVAPNMHNYIAKSLGLPWTFHATECPTLAELMDLAKNPTTAGLVVTMPYKNSVIPHLDEMDELVIGIGACNNVYYKPGASRAICGTNTDWRGIKGCLLEHGQPTSSGETHRTALIVGAGGACRAAVYALTSHLHCTEIYVLNRDDDEVEDLIRDSKKLPTVPRLTHIKSLGEAESCGTPQYVVGTVPDFPPQSAEEKNVAAMLERFLERPQKGVLLDMCFKPRRTRTIKLAEALGWKCVEGTHVIGYQIQEQWRLWAGDDLVKKLDVQGAWASLLKAADESKGINF